MDEATVAKTLQADLNSHKVKIQVKSAASQLYILASRDEDEQINYEFLFSLIQSRLEQLKIPTVTSFTLYGKVSDSKEPEWKKNGLIGQFSSKYANYPWRNPKSQNSKIENSKSQNSKPKETEKIISNLNQAKSRKTSNKISNQISAPKNTSYVAKNFFTNSERANFITSFIKSSFKSSFNNKISRKGILVIFATISVVLVVIFVITNRMQQQQLLNQAQILTAKSFNPSLPQNPAALENYRLNLDQTLSSLKSIPNLPFATYSDAQAQIPTLQGRLAQVDKKLEIERNGIKALTAAEKSAASAPQNPPQSTQALRQAQAKWQKSIQILQTIPPTTFARTAAQAKIKEYATKNQNAKRQLQAQLTANAIIYFLKTDTGRAIQLEMKDLKSTTTKPDFLNVCRPFVSFNLDPNQVKNQQVKLPMFAADMCDYLWGKKS